MTSSSRIAMGRGWYGVAVPRESHAPDRSNEPTPTDGVSRPSPRRDEARGTSRGRGEPLFAVGDASLFGLGSQMFSEVVAGVLLGYGIDYWLGTKNRWIVVGAIAGIVVAMATVMRTAMRLGAKPSLPRPRDSKATAPPESASHPGEAASGATPDRPPAEGAVPAIREEPRR
jgi:hypothetical protein